MHFSKPPTFPCRDLSAVLLVGLVAQNEEYGFVWLDVKPGLLIPLFQVLERAAFGDVVHNNDTHRVAVVGPCD